MISVPRASGPKRFFAAHRPASSLTEAAGAVEAVWAETLSENRIKAATSIAAKTKTTKSLLMQEASRRAKEGR
jgi:hypothetical protein